MRAQLRAGLERKAREAEERIELKIRAVEEEIERKKRAAEDEIARLRQLERLRHTLEAEREPESWLQ